MRARWRRLLVDLWKQYRWTAGGATTAYLLLTFALAPMLIKTAQAEDTGRIAPGGPTLKQTLEKGLKARRKSEFAFIANVVHKVDDGTLPVGIVKRTFLWARDNKQPFPMPYFEEAMRRQVKKIGVTL